MCICFKARTIHSMIGPPHHERSLKLTYNWNWEWAKQNMQCLVTTAISGAMPVSSSIHFKHKKKLLLYRTLSAKKYCWSLQYGPNKISIAIPTSTTVFSHLQVQERQSFLQITNGTRCGLRFPTSSLQIAPNVRKKSLQLTWRGDKSRHIFHIRRLLQKKHRKM